MKELQYKIQINAPKEKVWETLWSDDTFGQWAGLIDPGTYMIGDLKEGEEIQFLSAENGYGVTSLVEKCIPNEYLFLRHEADTKESGEETREKQWTGGKETYSLHEENGITTLEFTVDIPEELVEIMNESYPKAFDKIKELAER